MKILITGNMGYIGPTVVQRLRTSYPTATIVGLDMGYFAACLTAANYLPECRVDEQMFVDVRSVSKEMLQGVDAVVYLAAISNDPMGASFEAITLDVNHRAAVAIAQLAREAGAGSFVFASSCSVYGFAEGAQKPRSPQSIPSLRTQNPRWGQSKISQLWLEAILRSPVCVLLRPVG